MGHGEVLRPGEFQRMSAGTGVRHSEFNPSDSAVVHLYQIWLLPDRAGHVPSYEQKNFPEAERNAALRLVASPDGRDGSLTIHQDALVFLSSLKKGDEVTHTLRPGRHAWLQVLRGVVRLNETTFSAGDGAAISDESALTIQAAESAEVMLFDLP
jgi:redox-sensitive bicupin YhaK (pirin superfamily)